MPTTADMLHVESVCQQFCHRLRSAPIHCCAGRVSALAKGGEPFYTACRIFDKECAGHLMAEDLEELAFMVANNVSSE